MALPRDLNDADLAARTAAGDHAAVHALWARHADAVHDHVLRWSQDPQLAAAATAAAFTRLLDDLAAGESRTAPLPTLLRDARSHVTRALQAADSPSDDVPRALLVATDDPDLPPEAAVAAWDAATSLGTPAFSVLDLTTRRGCDPAALAAVLGLPAPSAQELLDDVIARTDESMRTAYAALTTVPAPVTARTPVLTAAVHLFGRPPALTRTVRLRLLVGLTVLAVAVVGVGLVAALRGSTATPVAGPATAAAEPVPSPTAEPSPTPALDGAASPSTIPLTSPEPTVAPSPTPASGPSPSPSPSPAPPAATLTVQVAEPSSGATFDATQDVGGQQVASVAVAAVLTGASPGTVVAWASSLAPGETLLADTSGEVVLRLTEPCLDTSHVLTVTATDPVSGQSATASVEVLLRETCEEPLAITDLVVGPGGGAAVTTTPTGDGRHQVLLDVAAEASDTGLDWAWRTSTGTLVASPGAAAGTIEVVLDDCGGSFTVQVDARRPGDAATATATAEVQTACPSG